MADTPKKTFYITRKDINSEEHGIWDKLPAILIDLYPWNKNGFMPKVEARLFYTDEGIHVQFKAFEKSIKIDSFNMNDPVCLDSCVEFFLNPAPQNGLGYLNFELNAVGILLLQVRPDRKNHINIPIEYLPEFKIKSSVQVDAVKSFNLYGKKSPTSKLHCSQSERVGGG